MEKSLAALLGTEKVIAVVDVSPFWREEISSQLLAVSVRSLQFEQISELRKARNKEIGGIVFGMTLLKDIRGIRPACTIAEKMHVPMVAVTTAWTPLPHLRDKITKEFSEKPDGIPVDIVPAHDIPWVIQLLEEEIADMQPR